MIGEQIKKHRIKKGLTQEELGSRVSVTTQSVSKWERGGAPDAELLPKIADALGVTVDALFGRECQDSLEDILTDTILKMKKEDGFSKVFSLITAACLGLSELDSIKESFSVESLKKLKYNNGRHYYACVSVDEGTIDAKMDSDFRYFFFMPEPENGYAEHFDNIDELSETFSLFADKDILKILFYMYSRRNTPVALSKISSKTKIDIDKTEEIMERLCNARLAVCSVVETDNGDIKTYTYFNETVVIPLLCTAKEIRDDNYINWAMMFFRNKPLF